MSIKDAKRFIRAEIEQTFQTIVDQLKQVRDTVQLFKKKTKPNTTAHDDQIAHIHSNALPELGREFDEMIKALKDFYNECTDKTYYSVPKEQRELISTPYRRFKDMVIRIMALADAEIAKGEACSMEVVLAGFWVETVPSDPNAKDKVLVVESMMMELKMFQTAITDVKKIVMRHINSGAFTTIIRNEKLVERYQIGDSKHEGEIAGANHDDDDDDESDGDDDKIVYEKDRRIDYKDEKAVSKQLLKEARGFIKAGRRNGDDDDDADGGDQADDPGDDEAPIVLRSALRRGGKALRPRSEQQIETLRRTAMASAPKNGEPQQPANGSINEEEEDGDFDCPDDGDEGSSSSSSEEDEDDDESGEYSDDDDGEEDEDDDDDEEEETKQRAPTKIKQEPKSEVVVVKKEPKSEVVVKKEPKKRPADDIVPAAPPKKIKVEPKKELSSSDDDEMVAVKQEPVVVKKEPVDDDDATSYSEKEDTKKAEPVATNAMTVDQIDDEFLAMFGQ